MERLLDPIARIEWLPKIDVENAQRVGWRRRDQLLENVAWDFLALTDDGLASVSKADAICFGTLAQRCARSRTTIQYPDPFHESGERSRGVDLPPKILDVIGEVRGGSAQLGGHSEANPTEPLRGRRY